MSSERQQKKQKVESTTTAEEEKSSRELRVSYQGVPGAYSEAACLEYFSSQEGIIAIPVPCVSFPDVFKAVIERRADMAFVPIENTLGGSIHANYDLLIQHNLYIHGELNFRVRHCLMCLPQHNIEDIKTAISHPQALAQCTDYLINMGIKAVPKYDTAGSAKMIVENKMTETAAICSETAAKIYGLKIISKGIEDEANNFTRFLCLGPSLPLCSAPSKVEIATGIQPIKSSLCFALIDTPGALFKALSVFALRDIHLCKIESRPGKNLSQAIKNRDNIGAHSLVSQKETSSNFKYFFFVDFLAHKDEERCVNAVRHLKEFTPFLRVFGSYPVSATRNTSMKKTTISSTITPLRIGILGFGNFGQFLAKAFVKEGHKVFATSRSDYTNLAATLGCTFIADLSEFSSQKLDVLIISVSILSFASQVEKLPWSLLKGTLVVDVLSVKIHPKKILLEAAPEDIDILCLHPMFGPESGRYSWKGLPLVYDKVRVKRGDIVHRFLGFFLIQGCRMLEMSCELHDAYAAGTQFITHTTGRLLSKLGCESSPINTKGFSVLLDLIENTHKDSWELYEGLYSFNPHSEVQLNGFQQAFQELKNKLQNSTRNIGSKERDRTVIINSRVQDLHESKTSTVNSLVINLKRRGISVIGLNIGEPDAPTSSHITMAAMKALMDGHTKYTAVAGLHELRSEICQKLKRDNGLEYNVSDITVSNGAKQSIMQAMTVLLNPGDEVIIPAPYWVSYVEMATLCGAKSVEISTQEEDGYILTPDALEKHITPRSKILVLCSPNNPTSAVYSLAQLQAIAKVLEAHPSIYVISDEIYEHIVYEGTVHHSFAKIQNMKNRTIVINGFSKGYCMTGFRLGYSAAPAEISRLILKVQSQMTGCASSISQYAGIAALQMGMEPIRTLVAGMLEKRNVVLDELRSIANVSFHVPQGAFYVFLRISDYFGHVTVNGDIICDADVFCTHLLGQYHLALVPGAAFGAPNCVRIAFASSVDNLKKGMTALRTCLAELKPQPKI